MDTKNKSITSTNKRPSIRRELIIGAIALIVIFIAVGGGLIYQKNERDWKLQDDKAKQEIQSQKEKEAEKEAREKRLDYWECMLAAGETYSSFWNSECRSFGINNKKDDCTLPTYNANRAEDLKKYEEGKCLKLYGDDF